MKRIILSIILGMLYVARLVWTGFYIYEAVIVFALLGWMVWSGVQSVKKSKQTAENARQESIRLKNLRVLR